MALEWGRRRAFVSEECLPQTISLLETRSEPLGIKLIIGNHRDYKCNEATFGTLLQYPSATGEIYNGKHGMSLRLDGLEKGVNDNARARGVVMHAADYVSNSFIKNNHRLGRSQGCPAVPAELSKEIISTIKDKSCFFIYHPSGASVFGAKSIS